MPYLQKNSSLNGFIESEISSFELYFIFLSVSDTYMKLIWYKAFLLLLVSTLP